MLTRQGKPVHGSSPLAEQLARKREDRRDDEGRCIEESSGSSFIEFVTADDRVHGFAYSQLMNYTLEKVAESEHQTDAPQDRLQLFFSTHDVTLTGWRLRDFLRLLRDGKVAAVKTGNARYADLRRDAPYVTEIKIVQVKGDG
ncbi:MAG: hypothetical protein AB1813_28615 [Verrucomicrobiota bacterium]